MKGLGHLLAFTTIIAALSIQEANAARLKRFLTDQVQSAQVIDTGPYKWSHWSAWSSCNATCQINGGVGQQSRKRQCDDGDDAVELHFCREPYSGDDTAYVGNAYSVADIILEDGSATGTNKNEYEYRSCSKGNCPVHGGWSQWSNFGACSVTTGTGVMTRSRQCNNPSPLHGGHDCIGVSTESTSCTVNVWSSWDQWSSCSVTCDAGIRVRSRQCTTGSDCAGSKIDVKTCMEPSCTINGGWSAWSDFGECSRSCGTGVAFRTRLCNNPIPQNGGLNCTGSSQEFKTCLKSECPIDGGWSAFLNMSCSTTCGLGVMTSFRTCTNPAPKNGGKNCTGQAYSFKHCNLGNCIVNAWSDWSDWSTCNATCNNGSRSRTRSCLSENDCIGEASQYEACNSQPCPIDGGWSNFSVVSCGVTCGRGQQIALRECDSPAPQFGGKDCVGLSHQITACERPSCPVDGGWSEWSNYSQCAPICGESYRTRYRTCSNPTPQNGGSNCTGNHQERSPCNNGPCPADMPICNKVTLLEAVKNFALFAPTRAGPCSNMDFIPQQNMMKDLCGAPADATTWIPRENIRTSCSHVPLYSPILKLHREYKTRNYGILLDCYNSKMKIATETCEDSIHEQIIDLDVSDKWEYFSMKWI